MYKALLVDLDNTLLDFNKAEERALTTTLLRYGLNDTKEIKEELGIDINEDDVKLFKTYKYDDAFKDVFYIKKDIAIMTIMEM